MRALVLEATKSKKLCNLASALWMKIKTNNQNTLDLTDNFLRTRFEYVEEKIETLQTPEYMLNGLEISGRLRGDCDDIATLHAALLTCMGIKVRFVAIRSNYNDPNFDHVYIEAQNDNGEWIPYDVTEPLGTELQYTGRLTVQV